MFKSNSLKVTPSFSQDDTTNLTNNILKNTDTESSPIHMIEHVLQSYNLTHLRYKLRAADVVLSQMEGQKILVFCSRKRDKVLLDRFLSKNGYNIQHIEAQSPENASAENAMPNDAENTIQNVNQHNDKQIFIVNDGTDITSLRGQIDSVLHFDIPPKPSDYLARLVMIFGSEQQEAKNPKSHLIATMREFSNLQILQNNYSFQLQEIKFDEDLLPNEDNNHYDAAQHDDFSQDHLRTEQPSYQQNQKYPEPKALYDSRTSYADQKQNTRSDRTGFEENTPAFFKTK